MRHLTDNIEQKYIHQRIKGIHLSRSKIKIDSTLNSLTTIMNIIESFPIFSCFVYSHLTMSIFNLVLCQMFI